VSRKASNELHDAAGQEDPLKINKPSSAGFPKACIPFTQTLDRKRITL